MSLESVEQLRGVPHAGLWRKLLSGNRARIAGAAAQINQGGLADDYVALLLTVRRRDARWAWRLPGLPPLLLPYRERARRSALTALGLLWGPLGRELATALDHKATHFDRERAHKALIRRRDYRAVQPLIDALLTGHAPEDWQCIATLGALGDRRAADALLRYVNLAESAALPSANALDVCIETGRALRLLNAHASLRTAQAALQSEQPERRAAAALVIGGWGDDTLCDSLLPLADDPMQRVRMAAVMALGELKAAPALDKLREYLNDADEGIRAAAERAVQQVMTAHPPSTFKFSRSQRAATRLSG